MASRALIARIRRNPRHRAMALGRLYGRCSDWIFDDYLQVHEFKGGPVLKTGECYFIETVTKYWVGRVSNIDCDWIELEDAAWIPDTGRFHEFIANGTASEAEPIRNGLKQLIPINCITAVTEWPHGLFRRAV